MLCHKSTQDIASNGSNGKISQGQWNYAMENDSKGMIVIGY